MTGWGKMRTVEDGGLFGKSAGQPSVIVTKLRAVFSLEVKSGHNSAYSLTVDGHKDAVGNNDLCLLLKGQFQRVPRELSSGS